MPDLLRLQQQAPEAAQWSAGALRDALAGCLAAEQEGQVMGFLLYRLLSGDEAEILNLAVDSGCRRQGIASRLMTEFLTVASGSVFLEVRESNAAARAFYDRWGFVEAGLRREYYHRPVENAVVLKKESEDSLLQTKHN